MNKFQDLVYFGYDSEPDSKKHESDFIKEIKERFPNVVLKDAYDYIKGYRREVYLEESQEENYFAWLIAFGWADFSLCLNMRLMDKSSEAKTRINKYIDMAKEQYPQNFKPQHNNP